MLILTAAQMLQVRVQCTDWHLIRPRLLADGNFAVSERVLTDPAHAQARGVLEQGTITGSFAAFENLGAGEFVTLDGKDCLINADDLPWTIQPTATGHRFELRAGEAQRAEFVSLFDTFGAGEEVWQSFTFEINVRDGFEAILPAPSWGLIAQWHGVDSYRSPVVGFDCGNNAFRIVTRSDAELQSGNGVEKVRFSDSLPSGPVNIVCRIVLGQAGELQIWRNGVEIVNFAGPIGYYNDPGDLGYLQWGKYNGPNTPTSAVTTSNMRWGLTDLSDKILNPDPV